jgi:hypothetical protein
VRPRSRVPDQRDVGDGLELEDDGRLGARLAEEREARGLAVLGGQRVVAEPTVTALGDHVLRAETDEVGEHVAVGVLDHGAVGHGEDHVLAVGALAVVTHALGARGRAAVRQVVELEEGGDLAVDAQDDAPAHPAGAAVGAGERLELLAADRGAAVPAVAA